MWKRHPLILPSKQFLYCQISITRHLSLTKKSKQDGQIISTILSNQGKERGIQDYACYELLNYKFSMIENQKQIFEKELRDKPKIVDFSNCSEL